VDGIDDIDDETWFRTVLLRASGVQYDEETIKRSFKEWKQFSLDNAGVEYTNPLTRLSFLQRRAVDLIAEGKPEHQVLEHLQISVVEFSHWKDDPIFRDYFEIMSCDSITDG